MLLCRIHHEDLSDEELLEDLEDEVMRPSPDLALKGLCAFNRLKHRKECFNVLECVATEWQRPRNLGNP